MTTNYYKTKLLTLLAMLVLAIPNRMEAQHMQASLSHYSTDDGLASNSIAFMTQDDYGFLWLATWNGISRFDGFNFYNYSTGIRSGIRGLHNRVDAMVADQTQNIWLKMYDGRLFVINRQTDRIIDPLEGVSGHDECRMDYFFTPYVTSTGDVLVSFKGFGIYKLRLDRKGLTSQQILTGSLTANCIVEGYHGDLWVGTEEGVHRIDMTNLSLEKKGYFLDENITQLTSNGYNIFVGTKSGKIFQFSYGQEPQLIKEIGQQVTGLYVDSHGMLWYSDLGDGAYRLKMDTGDAKFFKQRVLVPEFTSRGAFFCEAMGVLWVRLNHGGYGYYNRDTDEIEYFHNDPSNPWNLSNSVNAEMEMDDGVIWLSTSRKGLEKLELLKSTITKTQLVPDAESTLANEIRAMCYDKKRQLTFLCNKLGTIFIIDKHGNQAGTITHDDNGKPISRPYGMSADSKGNFWVCDKDNGVYKITPKDNGGYSVLNIQHVDNDVWSLSHNAAYQAVEDHSGNIWVATYGGGINILRKNKAGKYIALNEHNVLKKYPLNAYQKVRTLAVAKDGSVWAGTTDGILIMRLRNNNVTIEPMKEPEKLEDGLMSNDIVYLACAPSGQMWVGTNSGGISHTVKKDDKGAWTFMNYGIEEGLPSEEIRSITFDERGNVWLATDHMLCSFDVKKKVFTTFSQLDGVDDTMCSEGAAIMGYNGRILFGTLNGYYTVDRKKLTNARGSLLKLRITDFYLNGELQSPRLNNNIDYYVPESKTVKIPHQGDIFSFRFAALNYQLQHRMHYQYKLDGYDQDWVNSDKSRTAMYSDVPAGKYKFQVKAFLLESPDAYDIRTIEVEIPSYLIFSSKFVWVYMALMAIGLLYGLWWYQERLRKQYQGAGAGGPAEEKEESESHDTSTPTPHDSQETKEESTDEYELLDS